MKPGTTVRPLTSKHIDPGRRRFHVVGGSYASDPPTPHEHRLRRGLGRVDSEHSRVHECEVTAANR
jgi:hypothetical protein